MCSFSTCHGRLIPHALPAMVTSLLLGCTVILASFQGPTVAAPCLANALPPGFLRADIAAVEAAPALAPAAQLEPDPAARTASASELHSLGRAGTRQRPRACASSRPRQTRLHSAGRSGACRVARLTSAQPRSVHPRGNPRHFSAYATAHASRQGPRWWWPASREHTPAASGERFRQRSYPPCRAGHTTGAPPPLSRCPS